MRKTRRTFIAVLSVILGVGVSARADFELVSGVVAGGGGTSSGGVWDVTGTIGQLDAGPLTGGTIRLAGGFWDSLRAADTVLEVSIVSASSFSGAVECRPGFSVPQCNAQPFDTSQDLAFQGNGFAQATVAKNTIAGFAAIHQSQFANDGFYGNGASWIAGTANSWLKIDLGRVALIDRVTLGRDRTGGFNDRDPGQFTIEVTQFDAVYANGNDANDGTEYTQAFDSSTAGFSGLIVFSETLQASFDPVFTRFVKLTFTNLGTAIDEVEISAADLIISSGETFALTGDITVQNVTVEAGGTLNGGSSTLRVLGDFTVDGVFNPGTGTVVFIGPEDSLVTGSPTYHNLDVNKDTEAAKMETVGAFKVEAEMKVLKGEALIDDGADITDLTMLGTSTYRAPTGAEHTIKGDVKKTFDATYDRALGRLKYDGTTGKQKLDIAGPATDVDIDLLNTAGVDIIQTDAASEATVTLCDAKVNMDGTKDLEALCGSLIAKVGTGPIEIELREDVVVIVPSFTSVEVEELLVGGAFVIQNTSLVGEGGDVEVLLGTDIVVTVPSDSTLIATETGVEEFELENSVDSASPLVVTVGGGNPFVLDPGTVAPSEACGTLHLQFDRHTVGGGSHPGSSKVGVAGVDVRVFDKSVDSCALGYGVSWQNYPGIFEGTLETAACEPVVRGVTAADGSLNLPAEAGDYIVIGRYENPANDDVLYVGVSASGFVCDEFFDASVITMNKYLQVIEKADGKKVPAKYRRLTGSELLIIEPEYVLWDDTEQLYPFIFESVGDWGVTTSVMPPEGFVADYPELSQYVDNALEAIQFTITEVGSDLVPTETTFKVDHNGHRRTVRSQVGIFLTPAYAESRGFNVAQLRARGLIKERPQNRRGNEEHDR